MYITEYLSNEVKPGKVSFSPSQLLEVVQENRLTHIPLFQGLDFVGNISDEDLIELSLNDEKVDYTSYLEHFYLSESSTLLDAIQMMYTNQANILPIINEQSRYVGCITEMDIINTLAKFPFVAAQGVSMLVSIAEKELSMTAISNIIEVNNGKILGLMIVGYKEDSVYVLLKFSSSNLLAIGETFERYGYQVIQKFYNDEKQELLQSRYAQLLKYMNT
ncbi:CBS domain-containing protein [Empedobacter stercoris]|uniref:CBS domain-containing protein n=1 Tax=Empedobacter stercoris TaxID=1628248 RepID=UPI00166275D8|nr:CBS domain-containing protein [Empedobacter stercoris]MCA4810084.1 CBS domain-containing protein [Empedobacter stercoris]QNT15243.1 CBS domain-containing protein [Empedobacter stercoris]